ncbi:MULTISPECIES: hypothetical protein [unclassified Streptomyces]|uniref:hypothetical protein n=1 Tax=unclassified Streptomyces TaxID=2593676 RepID=UPI0033B86CA3
MTTRFAHRRAGRGTLGAVAVADFRTILAYAQQRHLGRLTFWSVNRDRPCTGGGADTCSGVSQQPRDFTRVFAQYAG